MGLVIAWSNLNSRDSLVLVLMENFGYAKSGGLFHLY